MTGHIFIYGGIGTAAGEVSTKAVKAQIAAEASADDYLVHIFSPGGDVFEGYGIYNALKNDTLGKPVDVQIEGLCASIATLIAGAGRKIIMNRTSEFMVHNPKISDLQGDSKQLRNAANQLDKIKSILIDVYERKTGLSKEKLWELYDNETWLTAQEAKNMGFVDEVVDAIKAVARVDLNTIPMEKKPTLLTVIKNWWKEKYKNEMTETLQDGTIIIVMSEDEDWTGKQVFYETGEPLPAGDHTLASGKVITVDGNSVITGVTEPTPEAAAEPAPEPSKEAQPTEEEMKKIAELEQQLAEAKAALEAATRDKATAEAKTAKFENRMNGLEADFLKLKEEAGKTVGDKTEPKKGPEFKNAGDHKNYDPMGDDALKFYRNRNLIPSHDED